MKESKQKKLLMLGGSDIQTPAIKRAKELGYFVITADYLPDNPGHEFSDKYFNVSTVEKEAILVLAQQEKVDGVLAYASDPAAPTVAYVGEKLGLNTNTYDAVIKLSRKNEFRKLLSKFNLPHPKFIETNTSEDVERFLAEYGKCVIKALDSSGSKGITVIEKLEDIKPALIDALKYSSLPFVVVEEYMQRTAMQICGDVFVQDGEVIFSAFGNVHFDDRCNSLVPCSITLPTVNGKSAEDKVVEYLNRIFKNIGVRTGGFNVDAFQIQNEIYLVEVGARNGGNLFTEIIQEHTNVSLVDFVLESSIGKRIVTPVKSNSSGYHAHYVLHSTKDGVLKEIRYSDVIKDKIIFEVLKLRKGDDVLKFNGSNTRVGVVLLSFESMEEMHSIVKNMDDYIEIVLE